MAEQVNNPLGEINYRIKIIDLIKKFQKGNMSQIPYSMQQHSIIIYNVSAVKCRKIHISSTNKDYK